MPAPELDEAREALEYWERRARRLPRWALQRRREARSMAARWTQRVREAERSTYGDGMLGTVMMLAFERRLPQRVRHHGRRLAKTALGASLAVGAACGAVVVLAVAVLVHLL
jgi:hypothetical protein